MITSKKYKQNFSMVSSENSLFLLKGKVASTYVTRVLDNEYSIDVTINPNDLSDYKLLSNYDKTNLKDVRTLEYFEKFIENDFDGKVISFIRNPLDRFLTGFVEDYVKGNLYINHNIFLENWLDSSKIKFDNSLVDIFITNLVAMQTGYAHPNLSLEEDEFKPIWLELLSFLLNAFLQSRYIFRETHREPWISFVYMMKHKYPFKLDVYDINRVDLSKIIKENSSPDELNHNQFNIRHNISKYFTEMMHSIYKKSPYLQKRLDDILYDEIILHKELIKSE